MLGRRHTTKPIRGRVVMVPDRGIAVRHPAHLVPEPEQPRESGPIPAPAGIDRDHRVSDGLGEDPPDEHSGAPKVVAACSRVASGATGGKQAGHRGGQRAVAGKLGRDVSWRRAATQLSS